VLFKVLHKPLPQWLDAEIARIKQELDQAHELRVQAEALLADYQKKQNNTKIIWLA
jgi:F0F1-type ATP synthase membrane subunit b/b'